MNSGSSAFGYGSQSVHMLLRPPTSPEARGTHPPSAATTGSHSGGLCNRPWGALLPHFWRESLNALRVRPHAMTDQLPGGRLWDINGLQSQKGPLSLGARLKQWAHSPASNSDVRVN